MDMDVCTDSSELSFREYYEAFDSDFYHCLCKDLAKELDLPSEIDLSRITHLELYGPSWETDPYQQILLRCLDHSLPKVCESLYEGEEGEEEDEDDNSDHSEGEDMAECLSLPTNPPPSPVLSSAMHRHSIDDIEAFGLSVEDPRETDYHDQVYLVPPGTPTQAGGGWVTQLPRRRGLHQRVASTGLLATVMAGDGSITWHFKEF